MGCHLQEHQWQKAKMALRLPEWRELVRRVFGQNPGQSIGVLAAVVAALAAVVQAFRSERRRWPPWDGQRALRTHTCVVDPVTVFLDQKDWITMARARVSRHKVQSRRELEAADALWEMVAADRVRLPLSCAHLIETARRGVQQDRIDLADAMLAGYGGWHMRHPIEVRGKELGWGLFGRPEPSLIRDYVFSRDPGTPFTTSDFEPSTCEAPDLSPADCRFVEQLTWHDAWSGVLREETDTAADRASADAVVHSWAASHQEMAQWMGDNPAYGRDIRMFAAARTIYVDLWSQLVIASSQAGLSFDQFRAAINRDTIVDFTAGLPYVGRVTDVTFQRLRNPQEEWERQDLNDLMYLCCAAAYADVVVAEKATVHRLRASLPRVVPGAVVVPNLRELQAVLQAAPGTM